MAPMACRLGKRLVSGDIPLSLTSPFPGACDICKSTDAPEDQNANPSAVWIHCLGGMLAPETAACLSELLKVINAHCSNVIDGAFSEPQAREPAEHLR
jgi:hypothetical protein